MSVIRTCVEIFSVVAKKNYKFVISNSDFPDAWFYELNSFWVIVHENLKFY